MPQCTNCNNQLNGYPLVCPYCHTNPSVWGSAPYSGTQGLNDGVYDPEVAAFGTATIGGILCFGPLLPVGLGIIGLAAIRYVYDKSKGR
jgi:hypothetical protein